MEFTVAFCGFAEKGPRIRNRIVKRMYESFDEFHDAMLQN